MSLKNTELKNDVSHTLIHLFGGYAKDILGKVTKSDFDRVREHITCLDNYMIFAPEYEAKVAMMVLGAYLAEQKGNYKLKVINIAEFLSTVLAVGCDSHEANELRYSNHPCMVFTMNPYVSWGQKEEILIPTIQYRKDKGLPTVIINSFGRTLDRITNIEYMKTVRLTGADGKENTDMDAQANSSNPKTPITKGTGGKKETSNSKKGGKYPV